MKIPFFTIGHSNRSIEGFIELVSTARVSRVIDIRKMPGSRSNPQFNEDTLSAALSASHISYEHVAALGGLRKGDKNLPREINSFWENRSFHNYADYALTEEFHAGLVHLLEEGRKQRCTIMCSEAVWWRCHRRIVTDYLIANGETVFHIMGRARLSPAHLTPNAVIRSDKKIEYPAMPNITK